MLSTLSHLRSGILLLLGIYLFVYPFSILLIALDIVPVWGTWMGGALLIMQGSTMGLWLVANYGRRGLLAALSILVISWAVEHLGVTTGFPFGGYHYTDTLNLKVFGVVPLAVPFAWLMVVPASAGITERLLHRRGYGSQRELIASWRRAFEQAAPGHIGQRLHLFVHALSADAGKGNPADTPTAQVSRNAMLALLSILGRALVVILGTASFALLLDLMIEPLAVHINGYWVWNNTGSGYYGVPGSNFVAWWVTSALLAAIMLAFTWGSDDPDRHIAHIGPQGAPVYGWLPSTLYLLNLMMFVLIYMAHGKLLAVAIGCVLLVYLVLVLAEPQLVRWIMGAGRSAAASTRPMKLE
jgi:putative membrane protein